MLEYDRISILVGNDINKINASKECDICHNRYFKVILFLIINHIKIVIAVHMSHFKVSKKR